MWFPGFAVDVEVCGLGAVPAEKGVFSANIALFLYSRYRGGGRDTTEGCVHSRTVNAPWPGILSGVRINCV